jgi:uncharacterized membrane protein
MYFSASFVAPAESFTPWPNAWVVQLTKTIQTKNKKQIWINLGLFIAFLLQVFFAFITIFAIAFAITTPDHLTFALKN